MRKFILTAVCFAIAAPLWPATLVLKKKFVETYKNRATIEIRFKVDHVKTSVNTISSGGKDGDIHVAGRATTKVGLPMVAEVINAKGQKPAVDLLRGEEGTEETIGVTGVWRLWFEHPGGADAIHKMGDPVSKPHNTNPDHVFEIHPITKVGSLDIISSLIPIPGYTAYSVDRAFEEYEKKKATIAASSSGISIQSSTIGFNYTEFNIDIPGTPKSFTDCIIANANVLDDDGDPFVAQLRRMVFPKGMAKINLVKKGAQLRVLGIPRLDLEWVTNLIAANPGQVIKNTPLPYEIVIIGIKGEI